MRHQKRGRKFNRTASHRKAMMSNLASALIIHKRIRTTDAKGKELRGFIDRLVTYAKQEDVHARRLIQRRIQGKRAKQITNILIHDIAPTYQNRNGGYTRLIKLNNRKNDNAPVSMIEFIDIAPTVINTESEIEEEKGDSKK
jgi:large subunit ribosomal protein L17